MNRLAITGCVAIGTAGVLAAAMSGVHAREKSSPETERNLVVTLVTPTVNQEVQADLSDPGLGHVITVTFSSYVAPREIIDNQNVVNRLRDSVEFLDSSFLRLPGTPSVRRNVFKFAPLSLTTQALDQGQYMLNLKSSIRNTRGRFLNGGVQDFTTSFTVGTDVYPPVLRNISPINGQIGIGLLQKIVATFNEPINQNNLATTVLVQDASTNPPTNIPGKGGTGVSLERGNFDVVFTPDPCFGYPPKTNIQFILQGFNPSIRNLAKVTTTLEDAFQNKFTRDNTLRWQSDPVNPDLFSSPLGTYDEFSGQFRMTFQTKGVKPPPASLRPGGPMLTLAYAGGNANAVFLPCQTATYYAPSCFAAGNVIHYTTDNGIGQLDLRAFITRYNQGITDFSLITVLPNTPVRVGRPAGITFDPRVINQVGGPFHLHTFIYVVDERTGTVEVVRSDNFKILGRLSGFSSPRDVAVATDTRQSNTTLYVSNFGSNQVVGIDLEGIKVSFSGQPGAPSPCAAITDNQSHRAFIPVGLGPTEISTDGYLDQRAIVCNTLSDSVSVIDIKSNTLLNSYAVGSNPVSVDWNVQNSGALHFALVANQGGLADPNGSLSLYVNQSVTLGTGFFGSAATRDGVESTFSDGVKNPTHVWGNVKWLNAGTVVPFYYLASNTGGSTALDIRLQFLGLSGASVTPTIAAAINVGLNPTSTIPDPYYPNLRTFSSVVGTGSVACFDTARPSIPAFSVRVPGVRRLYSCFTN